MLQSMNRSVSKQARHIDNSCRDKKNRSRYDKSKRSKCRSRRKSRRSKKKPKKEKSKKNTCKCSSQCLNKHSRHKGLTSAVVLYCIFKRTISSSIKSNHSSQHHLGSMTTAINWTT